MMNRREEIEKLKADMDAHFDNEQKLIKRARNLNLDKTENAEILASMAQHPHFQMINLITSEDIEKLKSLAKEISNG